MKKSKTVYIIDDDIDVRESICLLLVAQGFRAVTFSSAECFLSEYSRSMKGCIVSDIRMGGMSGLEMQDILNSYNAILPIIFITGHGDVPMSVKAVKNGAFNFLLKPFKKDTLLKAVDDAFVAEYEKLNDLSKPDYSKHNINILTKREKEIYVLFMQSKGKYTSKKIAEMLTVSVRTVEKHRLAIFKKMNVKNIAELLVS